MIGPELFIVEAGDLVAAVIWYVICSFLALTSSRKNPSYMDVIVVWLMGIIGTSVFTLFLVL